MTRLIPPVPDVTVVVRSAGERTEALCYHLLCEQVPVANIFVIHERPFTQALRRSYEIGIDSRQPWTLCVDGDVLLRDGAVATLLAASQQVADNVFVIWSRLLDKFFAGPRPACPYLYRTSLLPMALDCIPSEAESLRPETFTMKRMASQGYPSVDKDFIVGMHDYEQFYKDVYRKAFVHAKKHSSWLPCFQSLWRRLASEDLDYQVALWGLRAGMICDQGAFQDVQFFPQEIGVLMQAQGWQEKADLASTTWTGAEIGSIVDSFIPPPEYQLAWSRIDAPSFHARITTWKDRFRLATKRTDWLGIIPWFAGKGMQRLGRVLQVWAERR